MKTSRILVFMTACAATAFAARPVTNETVLKLLSADVGEELVLQAIAAGEPSFDTSPEAIEELKKAGATASILTAVITGVAPGAANAAQGSSAAKPATGAAVNAATLAPDAVLLIENGGEKIMSYTSAELRAAARGLGFGGAAIYAVLSGATSDLAVSSAPEFVLSAPSNAKPTSFLQMASFAVRKNGNREVMVGGGVMSVSIGIHQDRVIPLEFETLADQSRATTGHTLYRVKPKSSLAPGQYALVAKLSGQAGLGGGQVSGQWYDFMVK